MQYIENKKVGEPLEIIIDEISIAGQTIAGTNATDYEWHLYIYESGSEEILNTLKSSEAEITVATQEVKIVIDTDTWTPESVYMAELYADDYFVSEIAIRLEPTIKPLI